MELEGFSMKVSITPSVGRICLSFDHGFRGPNHPCACFYYLTKDAAVHPTSKSSLSLLVPVVPPCSTPHSHSPRPR